MSDDYPLGPRHPYVPPREEQVPMARDPDGRWTMEFAPGPYGAFRLALEQPGGVLRILGYGVRRSPHGSVLVPVSVVVREEYARQLSVEMWRELRTY